MGDFWGSWVVAALFLSPITVAGAVFARRRVRDRLAARARQPRVPRKWLGRAIAVKLDDPRERVVLATGDGASLALGISTSLLRLVTVEGDAVELETDARIHCTFASAEIEWRPRRRQYVEFGEFDDVPNDVLWLRTGTLLSLLGIVDEAPGSDGDGPYRRRDGASSIRVRSIDGAYWLTDGVHLVDGPPPPPRAPRWAAFGLLLLPSAIAATVLAVVGPNDLVWSLCIVATVAATGWLVVQMPALVLGDS